MLYKMKGMDEEMKVVGGNLLVKEEDYFFLKKRGHRQILPVKK